MQSVKNWLHLVVIDLLKLTKSKTDVLLSQTESAKAMSRREMLIELWHNRTQIATRMKNVEVLKSQEEKTKKKNKNSNKGEERRCIVLH